jgi:hypothetical protein
MPRSRPGKKEGAKKRQHDQQALNRLNDRICDDRIEHLNAQKSENKVSKQSTTDERKFSSSEV